MRNYLLFLLLFFITLSEAQSFPDCWTLEAPAPPLQSTIKKNKVKEVRIYFGRMRFFCCEGEDSMLVYHAQYDSLGRLLSEQIFDIMQGDTDRNVVYGYDKSGRLFSENGKDMWRQFAIRHYYSNNKRSTDSVWENGALVYVTGYDRGFTGRVRREMTIGTKEYPDTATLLYRYSLFGKLKWIRKKDWLGKELMISYRYQPILGKVRKVYADGTYRFSLYDLQGNQRANRIRSEYESPAGDGMDYTYFYRAGTNLIDFAYGTNNERGCNENENNVDCRVKVKYYYSFF